MDVVSFETAKRLKDAGFPQPQVGDFQFWAKSNTGVETAIVRAGGDQERLLNQIFEDRVYLPTATDILALLPMGYAVYTWQDLYSKNGWSWSCLNIMGKQHTDPRSDDFDNPAEACAKVWLELSETV
jgi:hypothetical protein